MQNVCYWFGFVPQLVTLAERTVKIKGDSDEEFKLDFIGYNGSTAELCILEAQKEVSKFGEVTARMMSFVCNMLSIILVRRKKAKLFSKLQKYEEITDRVEVEIADYLAKVSRLEMSDLASIKMRGMLSITNDLERVGDILSNKKQVFREKRR